MAERAKAQEPAEEPAPVDETPAEPEMEADLSQWDQIPVHQAWSRVMADVLYIGKSRRTEQKGANAANYNYRGIDDVLNIVGPVLRKHGVSVVPISHEIRHRDFTTSNNRVMHEAIVTARYRVTGPKGDHFEGEAIGEASDTSDKATTQAQSVALRTFYLNGLTIPTGLPDPEEHHFERSNGRSDSATSRSAGRSNSRQQRPADPDDAPVDPLQAEYQADPEKFATSRGWESADHMRRSYDEMKSRTSKLPDEMRDSVRSWLSETRMSILKFDGDNFAKWDDMLRAAEPFSQPPGVDTDIDPNTGATEFDDEPGEPDTEPF